MNCQVVIVRPNLSEKKTERNDSTEVVIAMRSLPKSGKLCPGKAWGEKINPRIFPSVKV